MEYKTAKIIKISGRILHWIIKDRPVEYSVLDDLEERLKSRLREGNVLIAYITVIFQLLLVLLSYSLEYLNWNLIMLNNYLKVAYRNLKKNKGFSFINIAGLAIGITCCLYILLYVQFQMSFDNYHKNIDRLYLVGFVSKSESGSTVYRSNMTRIGPAIRKDFPGAECVGRLTSWERKATIKRGDLLFNEKWVNYAEPEIFDLFSIPFLKGESSTALSRPGTVVISANISEKYFGSGDPVGETIVIDTSEYEITGVMENAPGNTHLNYNILMSWKSVESESWNQGWGAIVASTYLRLAPGINAAEFERKISRIAHNYIGDKLEKRGVEYNNYLYPVKNMHLSKPANQSGMTKSLQYIYIFIIAGVFILIIACMNFMNLSTARFMIRSREVGMRKVVGAGRIQLIRQFMGESILITLIASVIALIMAGSFMKLFNDLAGSGLIFTDILRPGTLQGFTLLVILTGISAGSYPAFFLSSFKITEILKGTKRSGSRGILMRKLLITGQFSISLILIIGTLIVYKQLNYMKTEYPGFDKEQKLVVKLGGWRLLTNNYDIVKTEFAQHSSIKNITLASGVPGRGINSLYIFPTGKEVENAVMPMCLRCDQDFLQVYNIKMLAGRQFNPEMNADITGKRFIVNKAAVKALGWSTPEEALGKELGENRYIIIGVTEDFHWYGLQNSIKPLVIRFVPQLFRYITFTVNAENMAETISFIENKHNKFFPDKVFEYFFVDENFENQYNYEERIGKILRVFSFLGIFIAFLGLFGLASFMAEQRTKEIGIRKTLGSSIPSIIILFLSEFTRWIVLSIFIASPVSYYFMSIWLNNFAYRTAQGILPYIFAGAAAIIITVVSVGFQAFKAARANPADSLQND